MEVQEDDMEVQEEAVLAHEFGTWRKRNEIEDMMAARLSCCVYATRSGAFPWY